jgi:hypothetical protein
MIERTLRLFDSHDQADAAARADDDAKTPQQRFDAFMELMSPHYAAAGRLQRVYRVDEFPQRKVRDDWGFRVQPVPQPESDGGH